MDRVKASDPPPAGPFGFDVRLAWRRDDPEIEADAIEFWKRHRPAARGRRARAARQGADRRRLQGRPAGRGLDRDDRADRFPPRPLRRDPRRDRSRIPPQPRPARARRAEPRGAGGLGARQSGREATPAASSSSTAREWGDFARLPVWPESELAGRRLRSAGPADPGPLVRRISASATGRRRFRCRRCRTGPPPGIEVRIAWRRDDPEIERDAIDFWRRLGNLPADVTPEERAKEIVLAAYRRRAGSSGVTTRRGRHPSAGARPPRHAARIGRPGLSPHRDRPRHVSPGARCARSLGGGQSGRGRGGRSAGSSRRRSSPTSSACPIGRRSASA